MLEASETTVEGFEEILMLPIRLCPLGSLEKARGSADLSPQQLLTRYVGVVTRPIGEDKGPEAEKAGWQAQPGYFEPGGSLAGRLGLSDELRYAEFVYFHPFIQKILFKADSAVRVLAREDIVAMEVELEGGKPALRLAVPRIQMFLFPMDVAIVAVQIRAAGRLPLDVVLRLLNSVRRTFPPFFDDKGRAGQCPERVRWIGRDGPMGGDWISDFDVPGAFLKSVLPTDRSVNRAQPLAQHWLALLRPLLAPVHHPQVAADAETLGFSPFEDDRMPVMAFVPVAGGEELRRQDQVRLALLEDPSRFGLAYPYGQRFLEDFETRYCYDRFYEPPRFTTRYFLTGYSFTVMGRREDWFFRELVRSHFAQHYFVMVLIAQVQKAALLVFWERLAEISGRYANEQAGPESRARLRSDLKCLIGDFADFAARFWFSEVSNQVQPTELFDRYSEHLGTKRLFAEVKEQIELMREVQMAADAEEHAEFEKQSAALQNRFTQLQDWWFPLLLATGILGMDGAFADISKWFFERGFYIKTGSWNPIPYEFWVRIGLLLLLWRACAWAVRHLPALAERLKKSDIGAKRQAG